MTDCAKCGTQVDEQDAIKAKDELLCEDCFIKYSNPSKPCGGGPGSA